MATRVHPRAVLEAILPLLGRSRCFAVFNREQEPLVGCYLGLKRYAVANVSVAETWLREYQVTVACVPFL